jgi:hypothetical protein
MFGRVGLALNPKKERNWGTVGHLGYLCDGHSCN